MHRAPRPSMIPSRNAATAVGPVRRRPGSPSARFAVGPVRRRPGSPSARFAVGPVRPRIGVRPARAVRSWRRTGPTPMPWNDVVGQDRAREALRAAVAKRARPRTPTSCTATRAPARSPRALAFGQALLCLAPAGGRRLRRLRGVPAHHAPRPTRISSSTSRSPRRAAARTRTTARAIIRRPPRDDRRGTRTASPTTGGSPRSADAEGSPKLAEHRRLPVEETVRRDMTMHAVEGGRRVGILPDVDHMRREAANSFLKLLEEPGPGVVLILTAERLDNVLPTILSRCQRIRFDALPAADRRGGAGGARDGRRHGVVHRAHGRGLAVARFAAARQPGAGRGARAGRQVRARVLRLPA